jgi:hypothetical protein
MRTASASGQRWAEGASAASSRYGEGARETTKDQASAAIAAAPLYQQGITESIAQGRYQKGLGKSGKAGWLRGVEEKGAANYGVGVTSPSAVQRYTSESGRFDGARNAASAMPRGPKGSPQNLQRVATVVNGMRAIKMGK